MHTPGPWHLINDVCVGGPIEPGWEVALESVLRERTGALEVSNLDWAKAFFSDTPPAKLSLYSLSGTANANESAPSGLKTLMSMMKVDDPGLRALLLPALSLAVVQAVTHSGFLEHARARELGAPPKVARALHVDTPVAVIDATIDALEPGFILLSAISEFLAVAPDPKIIVESNWHSSRAFSRPNTSVL